MLWKYLYVLFDLRMLWFGEFGLGYFGGCGYIPAHERKPAGSLVTKQRGAFAPEVVPMGLPRPKSPSLVGGSTMGGCSSSQPQSITMAVGTRSRRH